MLVTSVALNSIEIIGPYSNSYDPRACVAGYSEIIGDEARFVILDEFPDTESAIDYCNSRMPEAPDSDPFIEIAYVNF